MSNTINNNMIYLPVEGIESEHCALIIENKLLQIEGIFDLKVEVNNRRVSLRVKNNQVLNEAIEIINSLSYRVITVKENINVVGMSCASCALSVENIIKNSEGVIASSVNFANAQLSVEYLPNITKVETLKNKLQMLGYDLIIEKDLSITEDFENLQKKNLKS